MPKLVPGLYDSPLTRELDELLVVRERALEARRSTLDPADSNELLARHIARIVRTMLLAVPEDERLTKQTEICNELVRTLGRSLMTDLESEQLLVPAEKLTAVYRRDAFAIGAPSSPDIPLSQSDLLVNAHGEPRVVHLLLSEIESADRIDLVIAFIRWSGLRLFESKLRQFLESRKRLRVITTTYTGSTERRAIERLVELGAEVKVSYQTDNTRLHAKSWLFHRESGFSTAFIGSSNLSTAAMTEGVEWNVRLSEVDAPSIVRKFSATFESYWADPDFESYDPVTHRERFDRAVSGARADSPSPLALFDIQPWPHQREILEKLQVERYRHGRWRNLVVAATGTGKTVVAALDYRRLCEDFGRRLSLLFVAHRKEILQQSVGTFRGVMRDGSFGELLVDGHRPREARHLFASIQSLATLDVSDITPDAYDIVIVDEFHHAAAPTYRKLLDHLRPRVLLGLTATPERTDGQSVLEWFDGRFTVELRLWDALERGLLSPFHYFGVYDQTDLSRLRWVRGQYDPRELENLYTGDDVRLRHILNALHTKVSDISLMRALGFCVGVTHAEYMARKFNEAGILSAVVTGSTASVDRDEALRKLRDREINALFAVDIFNEGVDVPEVDTVMFLRPTESATIFLQQLGRGLRRTRTKECLTVLDFIGNAHRNFRFDLRYRALTGATRREVEEQVERGFPLLPAGCSIQLDRESSRVVLDTLRRVIGARFNSLVAELRQLGPGTSMARFLEETKLDVEDLYRSADWSWSRLKREAFPAAELRIVDGRASDEALLRGVSRLLHLDDVDRISFYRRVLGAASPPRMAELTVAEARMLEALLITLFHRAEDNVPSALARLWEAADARSEILELLDILDDRAEHATVPISETLGAEHWRNVPLSIHAQYSRDDVMAGFGRSTLKRPLRQQTGVLWDEATSADLFFVTLEKSEKHYSPTTRYRDYAIAPDLFHWESQSVTRDASATAQRYINHTQRGSEILLFVREKRSLDGNRTSPFLFVGPADYVQHGGERPISFIWKLRRAMPLDFFKTAKIVAG
jgi:superfamily II DNA or RNA helicase/HKD family nuclease